jgi:hypothetical protein
MVHVHTKIPISAIFWRPYVEWKRLVYFMATWEIMLSFSISSSVLFVYVAKAEITVVPNLGTLP